MTPDTDRTTFCEVQGGSGIVDLTGSDTPDHQFQFEYTGSGRVVYSFVDSVGQTAKLHEFTQLLSDDGAYCKLILSFYILLNILQTV